MKIDKKTVAHIAKLSRLEFSGSEQDKFIPHFNNILTNFEVISKIDTVGVEPTVHAFEEQNVLRVDEAEECYPNELLLKNAPDSEDGAYLVPKVVE